MLRSGALCAAALVLSIIAPSASASALASASLEITNFVWYVDSDKDGKHSPADQILTTALDGTGQNTTVTASNDSADIFVLLDVGGSKSSDGSLANRTRSELGSDVDPGGSVTIGENSGSAPASGDFKPLPLDATGQFVNSDFYADGFYADVPGVTSGGEWLGMRADASLPVLEPDTTLEASSVSQWDNDADFTANGSFNTYFEIDFVAQAYAYLSESEGSESIAKADLEFEILMLATPPSGPPEVALFWLPEALNLSALTQTPGDADPEQPGTSGVIYSYTTQGMTPLAINETYQMRISASADVNAAANSPPAGVLTPPPAWLMVAGLLGLMATRKIVGYWN